MSVQLAISMGCFIRNVCLVFNFTFSSKWDDQMKAWSVVVNVVYCRPGQPATGYKRLKRLISQTPKNSLIENQNEKNKLSKIPGESNARSQTDRIE